MLQLPNLIPFCVLVYEHADLDTLYYRDMQTMNAVTQNVLIVATVNYGVRIKPGSVETAGSISVTSPMTTIILRPSSHCPPEFIEQSSASPGTPL